MGRFAERWETHGPLNQLLRLDVDVPRLRRV